MEYQYLSETVKIKKISETDSEGLFEIEGLYPGYGLTLGNALRRILLASLPGAAVTTVKIKGVKHEFSAIEGVKEDAIEIILNLKRIRFKFYAKEEEKIESNLIASEGRRKEIDPLLKKTIYNENEEEKAMRRGDFEIAWKKR